MPISLSRADKARLELVNRQKKQIRALYSQVSKEIKQEALKLDTTTATGAVRTQYLKMLQEKIGKSLENIGKEVEEITKENMLTASNLIGSDT